MEEALGDFQEIDAREVTKTQHEEWEEFLTGDQRQDKFLWKNPAENKDHWDAKNKVVFNIADQVLKALSYLYVGGVSRQVGDPDLEHEPADEVFKHIWRRNSMDYLMRDAMYWTRLFGRTAIEIRWQGPSLVRYLLRMPYQLDVLQNPDDPEAVDAVRICVNKKYVDDGKDAQRPVYRYHVWTRADTKHVDFAIVEDDAAVEDSQKRLPLTDLPVVFPASRLPHGEFWIDGLGVGLIWQNRVINKLNTELGHMALMLHGQPVAKNCDIKFLGPDTIAQIRSTNDGTGEGEADFDIVNPNSQLNLFVDVIHEFLEELAVSYSLPREYLTKLKSSAESGVAIMAKRLALRDDRQEQESIWRAAEEDLFRKSLEVARAHGDNAAEDLVGWGTMGEAASPIAMGQIDPQIPFSIRFPEHKEALAAQDQVLDEKHRLDIGVSTPLDILRERQPELTQKQAEAKLAAAQQEKQARFQAAQDQARQGFLQQENAKPNPFQKAGDEDEEGEEEEEQQPPGK
jgi:hypothetical protein